MMLREQAQIAFVRQEGAWGCAVDAMRLLDLTTLLDRAPPEPASPPPPPESSSA